MTRPGSVRVEDAIDTSRLIFEPLAPDGSPRRKVPPSIRDDRDQFIVLAPGPALLHPDFSAFVMAAAADRLDVEVFYADDVALGAEPQHQLRLKPQFNVALLYSKDYLNAPLIIRSSALLQLGGLDLAAGTAALYDLALRAEGAGLVIDGIREVLLAQLGDRPLATESDRLGALERRLAKEAMGILPGLAPRSSRVRRTFRAYPKVTLLVPTCQARRSDGALFLGKLLDSLERSTWPADRLEVLIGDDLEERPPCIADRRFSVEWMHTPRLDGRAFNYAEKMNRLWRAANSEHLVMLNDDVEICSSDWLEALMTFAVQDDVGGVGARLLYPDGRLQHAGMFGGIFGVFAHAWIGQDPDQPTYCDWAKVQRDFSVVTGAVFATRRSALALVNGFDEHLALEYNDVDLCLKLLTSGLRIVQAPDAVLIHHEKASRGDTAPPGSETASFLRRWGQLLEDDPAFHPGLRRDTFVVQPKPVWGAWYNALDLRPAWRGGYRRLGARSHTADFS